VIDKGFTPGGEPKPAPTGPATAGTASAEAAGPARFRISREELLTLGRILDLPAEAFAGLVDGPVSWPSREVALAVLHGLMARGLLTEFEGGTRLEGRLAAMIEIVASPELILCLYRGTVLPGSGPGGQPTASVQVIAWFVRPGAAVEVVGDAGGVYELQEVPISYVIGRVLAYSQLSLLDPAATEVSGAGAGGAERLGEALAVPMPALRKAGPAADLGDLEGAAAALAPAVGADGAKALASALSAGCDSYLVTSRYRLESGRIEGAVTAWLDAGDAGLWEVPGEVVDIDAPDAVVTFTPASGQYLYDSIRAGLPQAA
jgi:hypothetical protein